MENRAMEGSSSTVELDPLLSPLELEDTLMEPKLTSFAMEEVEEERGVTDMVVSEPKTREEGDASTHGSRVGPSLLYDYRENFTTDKVFATDDGLIEWARSTGQQHGLIIVIKASKKITKNRRSRMTFACERNGKYKKFEKKSNDWIVKKRLSTTGTKKCECPFELRCVWTYEGWTVTVFNGTHNRIELTIFVYDMIF